MSSLEELLSDILDEARRANQSLGEIASSGGPGGGVGGLGGLTGGEGGGAGGAADLLGLVSKGSSKGAAGAIASRAAGVIGGAALAGVGAAIGAGAAVLGQGVQASAQTFLTSGGNFEAAGGSFQRGIAGAIGGGFVGEVLGLNAAERVAQESEQSLRGLVEASFREGGGLSREQISGLVDLSYQRAGRAEEGRRILGEEVNARFGDELDKQTDGALDRAAAALEAAADGISRLVNGRSV